MSGDQQILKMEGFLTIRDYNTGEVLQEAKNAINYENMSEAIADTLSSRGYGEIYQMAFGNGGASVDETGVITYLPPNTTGQNAALYNQTYAKIVDDTSVFNLDPTRNKMTVFHTTGRVYTDILVQCLLDYGEPAGQAAFDNSTQTDSNYIFDELGLLANYGTDANGNVITRLLTHVIFHPVQKSLNRQIQIDYTVRIQSLTNLVTI
jgi:hypothetical protein|tara:strand:+ start:6765 stop:7385 length:621 start_codon:yes stop_codon:yes gene_type:complete